MSRTKLIPIAVLASLSLAACSGDMDELQAKVTEIKNRPGERIEPLPEIKPYEPFKYEATSLRSPFVPTAPSSHRRRERRASGREACARIPRTVPD